MTADMVRAISVPVGMAVVGALAWQALRVGIDGALLMTALAIVGGLGGYEVKALVNSKTSKSQDKG